MGIHRDPNTGAWVADDSPSQTTQQTTSSSSNSGIHRDESGKWVANNPTSTTPTTSEVVDAITNKLNFKGQQADKADRFVYKPELPKNPLTGNTQFLNPLVPAEDFGQNTIPLSAYTPVAKGYDGTGTYIPYNADVANADKAWEHMPSPEDTITRRWNEAVDKATTEYGRQQRNVGSKEQVTWIQNQISDIDKKMQDIDLAIAETSSSGWDTSDLEQQKATLQAQRDAYDTELSKAEALWLNNPENPNYRTAEQKAQTEAQQKQLDDIGRRMDELSQQAGWVTDPDEGIAITNEMTDLRIEALHMLRANRDLKAPGALAGYWVEGSALQGAGQFDQSVTEFLDKTLGLGDFMGEIWTMMGLEAERNPITALNRYIHNLNEQNAEYYGTVTQGNKGAQTAMNYGTQTVAALPAAALAYMTAGSSMASTAGLTTEAYLNSLTGAERTMATIGEAVKQMSASPNFIASFVQEAGNSYESAINAGMSEADATMYSMLYGYLAATVEVGGTSELAGGTQQFAKEVAEGPQGVVPGLVDYAKSIVGEIGEENIQGMLERGLQAPFGVNTALWSNDPNQNAIIKPNEMLEEAKGAAVVSALMGGPGAIINTANSIQQYARTSSRFGNTSQTTVADALANIPSESAEVSDNSVTEESGNINTPATDETSETHHSPAEEIAKTAWEESNIEKEADGVERERGESRNIRTDEARAQELRDFKEKNPDMYKVLKNDKLIERAMDIYQTEGTEGSAATLEQALADARNGKKLPLEMVVLHKLVCDDLAKNGQVERANRISSDLAAELTYGGRLGQANAVLRNSSATARADAFQKTLTRLIGENNANVNQEAVDDLVNRYRAAETDEARDAITDEAMTAIAQSSPTTFMEAITAIRYLNMLGNFKTQIRNVLGNTGMLLAARAKNRTLALEQMAWNAVFRKHQVEQTNTLTTDRTLFKEAWQMFNEDQKAAYGEGKYSDVTQGNKQIQEKKTVFKWNWKTEADNQRDAVLRKIADAPMKVLEAYRKATSWAMEQGDVIFQKITYAQVLADYAKAQGYNSLADVPADQLQTMREYAIKEAQEATFHDKNAVSEAFSGFDKNWSKFGKTAAQGIVPFRQTPANVGVRMEEYSPLGLINTFVDTCQAIKGKKDVNTVLNAMAKTVSGTGLAALGFALAKAGLARGKEDDDELASYERNVQGLGDYSIVLPDGTTVSLDWLQPESASFFVGVEAAKYFEDGVQADDFISLLGSTTDIALNMSFLSGLSNSLDDIAKLNGDKKAVVIYLLNSLLSYSGQIATNSLAGQAEQASERYRQTSYSDPDSILPTDFQKTFSKLTGKMPGIDYQQADYIDAWGRRQDNGPASGRIAESFFSPAYINENSSTPVDDELKRLHEAVGDEIKGSVFPSTAQRSTTIDGERLTPEEYELYATTGGQKALELVTDFINSDGYEDLDDKTKAETIKKLYDYAATDAKNAVLEARGKEPVVDKGYEKAKSVMEAADLSWAEYLKLDDEMPRGYEDIAKYLFDSDLTDEQAEAVYDIYNTSKNPYSDLRDKFQTVADSGFTEEEYNALGDTISAAKDGKEPWDSAGNSAVVDAVLGAVDKGLSEDAAASLIIENTSKNYKNPFSALLDAGHRMPDAMDILSLIDVPDKDGNPPNRSIEQKELTAYYKAHPEEEEIIALIWDAMGYTGKNTKTWEDYKASLK